MQAEPFSEILRNVISWFRWRTGKLAFVEFQVAGFLFSHLIPLLSVYCDLNRSLFYFLFLKSKNTLDYIYLNLTLSIKYTKNDPNNLMIY
ncbi:hypothetical protein DsansV1_C15g0133041 [Dioscorea sansibarensis]